MLKLPGRLSSRGEASLFLSGVNLMLLNFIMVQHATIAFPQMEIAVIVFSLSYFSGVSLGYLISDRISKPLIRRLLPVFLIVQMAMLLTLQCGYYGLSTAIGGWLDSSRLGEFAASSVVFLLVTTFATSLYAVFLPMVIDEEGIELRRCYSIEVAGSIVGLLLVPLLASISHEALMGGYFVTFLALAFSVGARPAMVAAMGVAVAIFLFRFAAWDQSAATWYYARYYEWKIDEIALTRYTPYHKIEVVKGNGSYKLILNGKRQFGGDPKRTYSYFVAEYPARLLGTPKVALLGCGSMATVGRIGDFVPSIQIVDLDAEVFAASRRFFPEYNRLDELHNWTFTDDDAKHWVANATDRFDLILHDIPPAHSRQVALTYTEEFFRLVKARLQPGGLFSISSLTPFSKRSHYGKRMMKTLAQVFDHYFVLVHHGSVYFYGGGAELKVLDPEALKSAVDPERSADVKVYTKEQMDELVKDEDVITTNNVGELIYD